MTPSLHEQFFQKNQLRFPKKQLDAVLGGAEAWKDVEQTSIECARCKNGKASRLHGLYCRSVGSGGNETKVAENFVSEK